MTGQHEETQNIVNRTDLITDLENYVASCDEETSFVSRFLSLLSDEPRCFYRDCFPAHITGSALLLDHTGTQILMNHHKSLNKWLNFGGHADGEEDILAVAIRETMEESGLTNLKPYSANIIDIDIHTIPANNKKGEPEHEHFDIRYLMQMTSEDNTPILSNESIDLRWVPIHDAFDLIDKNDGLHRFIRKVISLC